MRVFVSALVILFLTQCASPKKGKKHMISSMSRSRDIQSDATLEVVEPSPPDLTVGKCNCVCCEPANEPLVQPKCANDIVVAVDSSACFRDHHGRMMRFLKKLVRRIGRTPNIQYGGDETRLALMQFSSDIIFPLELSSFENYTNPSTRKGIMEGINRELESLRFLGEGSFLNKALNATVDQIESHPRPDAADGGSVFPPRPIVILLTNGKSHPTVTMDDIEYSISDLEAAGISVVPVSVTRECHGIQADGWNEGLCPDTIVLNKLAKLGGSDTFLEMTSHDTLADIIKTLEACYPKNAPLTGNTCNNCTCSCELPIGPQGPPGPRGIKGDFVEGKPGEKGEVGPKGEVGKDGKPGENGDKGENGTKGDIGPKGDIGEVGSVGDKGEDGEKGATGDKGEVGEPGRDGPRGPKGDDGQKGEVGEKGGVGEKGEAGRNGTRGFDGEPGSEGPKGEKGFGETGDQGPPGPRGRIGRPGEKGVVGPKGMTGSRGLCGKPGPAGKPGIEGIGGVDGIDGQNGPPGRQGPRGEPGAEGDKGESGEIGLPGIPGGTGLPGERGPVGAEGERGLKGEKGEPSTEAGPIGPAGLPGRKGTKGSDGRDGLTGPEGQPGRQGPRGEQGSQGPPGVYDVQQLRPIIADIIRELLPGDCGEPEEPSPPEEPEEPTPPEEPEEPTPPDITYPPISTTTGRPGGDDICSQPAPYGNCNESDQGDDIKKYYWNEGLTACVQFNYKGCPGGNVFDTQYECEKHCQGFSTFSTTSLPPIVPIEPGCYHSISNVGFVIDGSASVGEEGFAYLQNFLTSVVSAFHTVGADGVQVGVIQYNDEPRFELYFDQCTSKEVALNAVDSMKYLSGNTQTGKALNYLSQVFDELDQEGRSNAKKVAVVITDGRSQDDVNSTAAELKNKGVSLFAIGAGEAEYIELKEIASAPTDRFVYTVTDYAAISSITESVVERICEEVAGIYKAAEEAPTIEDEIIFTGENQEVTEVNTIDDGSGGVPDIEQP